MAYPDTITAEPLTAEAFAPFGEVLEASGAPPLTLTDCTKRLRSAPLMTASLVKLTAILVALPPGSAALNQ